VTVSLRRVGIVLGSFVAAQLCVWLIGGLVAQLLIGTAGSVLPWLGPLLAGAPLTAGAWNLVVTVVLGWLIYRDIVRRERKDLALSRPTA
jgi:hypothetical protein